MTTELRQVAQSTARDRVSAEEWQTRIDLTAC